jgi:hypothetical protein
MPEKILTRSSLDRDLPIWRIAPARHRRPVVTVGWPPHGFVLISGRERRTLPPAMIPTDSGSKLVRRR